MSGIFGGSSQTINTSVPIVTSLRVQTSTKGKTIPVVFGKTRISPNLIDYQDFTAIAHTETQSSGGKGGGGSSYSNTTYTYTAALVMALCDCGSNPVSAVQRVWAGKSIHASPEALGFTVFNGGASQAAWGYMQSAHPERALSYRGIAYVAAGAYDLGDSAMIPNHSMEIDSGTGYSSTIRDALPSLIVQRVLTDSSYGARFPAEKLGDVTAWNNYCIAQGLFLSPAITEQLPAQEFILHIADICNTDVSFSGGKLRFRPRADSPITGNGVTYTPDITPVYDLSEDDYLDTPVIRRSSNADAYNRLTGKFYNRASDYNEEVAEAKDQANIEIYGMRSDTETDLSVAVDAGVVQRILQLKLQRGLNIRNEYEFRLGWKYALLEEGDIVTLSYTQWGLDRQAVVIKSVEEDKWGELTLIADELQIGTAKPARYSQLYSDAYKQDFNSPADACATPLFVELESSPWRTGDDISLGVAVAGSGKNWGGCTVWVSWDNTAYERVGRITAPARYGKLTGAVGSGINASAPIALTGYGTTMTSASATAADQLATLCLIDNELCAYSAATLTAASNYTLTLRGRGSYGSMPSAHSVDDRFTRLDDAIFWTNIPYDKAGSVIYVKLTAVNMFGGGEQDISSVSAHSFTIVGQPPDDVTGLIATAQADAVQLSWDAVPNRDLVGYEVRVGATFGSSTVVEMISAPATSCRVLGNYTGSRTYWVRAYDTVGHLSDVPASVVFSVSAPLAPTITRVDVIDNNVLIYWQGMTGVFPIRTYQVRRGDDWATAEVIGVKDGAFTTVFEQIAGTYRYWVAAIDNCGNMGVAASQLAEVNQPPDYIFYDKRVSDFSGSKVSALVTDSGLHLPFNTSETWSQHFSTRSWATIDAQIAAGYPLYCQPAPTTASYTEVVDYGVILPNFKVSVLFDRVDVSPGATLTVSLSTSVDGVSYSAPVVATSAFFSNFRYLKILINVTSDDKAACIISNLSTQLDVKRSVWAGSVNCLASDVGGTVVYLTKDGLPTGTPVFVDVTAVTVSPNTTSNVNAIYDFVDTPYPTQMKILLFNAATGARLSGTASYTATGVVNNG